MLSEYAIMPCQRAKAARALPGHLSEQVILRQFDANDDSVPQDINAAIAAYRCDIHEHQAIAPASYAVTVMGIKNLPPGHLDDSYRTVLCVDEA